MTIIEIIVTILLGTAAGFINTFAGGGSMLVVPFLIFIGLTANVANAPKRIAILLQNVVSVSGFKQKKILDFKTDSKLLLPVALGSIVGAFIAVDINEIALRVSLARMLFDELRIISIRHKADVLAVMLAGIAKPLFLGNGAHGVLVHAAQGKQRVGQLVLR